MFPQEVDVINIALVLPVFSAAVVKATSVWVLCVFGNGRRWWDRWVVGWGRQRCACTGVPVVMHMCVRELYRGGVQCTTLVG